MSDIGRGGERPLPGVRLAEARSLLEANQMRRARAEGTLTLVAVLALLAALVAIAARRAEVLLPLPPIALLLTSLSFQQYVDVTVLGHARAHLEHAVNEVVGGTGLVYETRIADVRHGPSLRAGVRLLQVVAHLGTAGGIVTGAVVAVHHGGWVTAAYAVTTIATGASCVVSYRDMRHAGKIADDAFGAAIGT
jgi:hypothetical protein